MNLNARNLTWRQRDTVRAIADGKPVSGRSFTSIQNKGLATVAGRGEGRVVGKLTKVGQRVHDEIMSSGDGPEALKDLLRF